MNRRKKERKRDTRLVTLKICETLNSFAKANWLVVENDDGDISNVCLARAARRDMHQFWGWRDWDVRRGHSFIRFIRANQCTIRANSSRVAKGWSECMLQARSCICIRERERERVRGCVESKSELDPGHSPGQPDALYFTCTVTFLRSHRKRRYYFYSILSLRSV